MEKKKGLLLVCLMMGTLLHAKTSVKDADRMQKKEYEKKVGHRENDSLKKWLDHSTDQPSRKELANQRRADRKAQRIADGADDDTNYVTHEDRSRKMYADFDYGFMKYSLFTTKFKNAAQLLQTITKKHSTVLPMIRVGFGLDFVGLWYFGSEKTTHGRIGLEVTFAKRNNAVETFYTGTNTGIIGKQDINRGELMLVASYDLWRDHLALEGGIGVVGGALKDYRLYQSNGSKSLFTGQYLKPHSANLGGFFGLTVAHRFEQMKKLRFELGYRAVFSTVKYYTTVYQTIPDPAAAQIWQTVYNTVQSNGFFVLPQQPKFRICSNQLALTVVVDF